MKRQSGRYVVRMTNEYFDNGLQITVDNEPAPYTSGDVQRIHIYDNYTVAERAAYSWQARYSAIYARWIPVFIDGQLVEVPSNAA